MKKILFFLTVLLLPFLIKAQDPQPVYGDYVYPGSVFFDNGLYIPVRDTTGFAPYRVGAMVILPQDTIGHTTTPPVRFWNGVYWGTISGGSGGVYFAGNGLSLTGNTFKLGGTPLSQNTDILSNGYTFTVNNSAKGLPILGLTPSGQRIGYRELDSTQSGFDFTPNGKQGIFKFYLKGASIATLQQGSLQLSDSLTNVYFYAGKDIVNLIGSSGSNYAQFQPGNVSFNTSSGSNIAQFTTGYAKLPAYTNTDSTKYLTTNSSGQLVLKSPSAIRAIDSVVMDFPSGTISYRYTTGGYLPVFIGKPVDSLRYDPSTGIFYTRLTTGGEVAVPTGLVDSIQNRLKKTDTTGKWLPVGTSTAGVPEGSNLYYTDPRARAAISGVSPISYNSSTGAISHATSGVTAGTYTKVTVNTTGHVTAGAGIDTSDIPAFSTKVRPLFSAGAGISYGSTTGIITNTGILNQTATQEAKDFRISGRGYTGNFSAGVPFLLSTNTKIYAASNLTGDPYMAVSTFQSSNEAGLDTTGSFAFFRFWNNNVSISDTTNQMGFVRANSLIGQITGSGALRDEGINQGSPSTGKPALKIGYYAETDFLNWASASANMRFLTKSFGALAPAERMRITGSGNVGVGTTSPMAAFHVNGTNPLALTGLQSGAATDSILTIAGNIVRKIPFASGTTGFWSTAGNTGTSAVSSFLGTSDNISLRFRTNNIQRMFIDSAFGNVAIGSTVANRKLNVSDSNTVAYASTGSAALPPGLFSGVNNTSNVNGTLAGITINSMNSTGTGQIAYLGSVSNTSGFTPEFVLGVRTGSATYAERLRIAASGNMGVGETNPQATADIKGSSASTGNALRVQNSAATSLFEVANNNTVTLKGAAVFSLTTQSANYTVAATDYTCVTATSGITYTLGVPSVGRIVYFKNRSGGNISVALSGGATIDGSATTVTVAAGGYLCLQGYTSTDWIKLNP